MVTVAPLQAPPAPEEDVVPAKRVRRTLFASWWWALPALAIAFIVHYLAVGIGGVYAFTDWRGIGPWNWVGVQNFRSEEHTSELQSH